MATLSNYDQQVRDFFSYLRVEAGLSHATLDADTDSHRWTPAHPPVRHFCAAAAPLLLVGGLEFHGGQQGQLREPHGDEMATFAAVVVFGDVLFCATGVHVCFKVVPQFRSDDVGSFAGV